MSLRTQTFLLTGTSKTSAGTTILQTAGGFSKWDFLVVDALLVGATGGTLDLYLQKKITYSTDDVWLDWVHFAQLTDGAAAVRYTCASVENSTSIVTTGSTVLAGTGTPALAAGAMTPGHPGDSLRLMGVAGSGTSAGAVIKVYITGFQRIT